jgi:type I restriction enzyme R subunit
MGRNVAEAEELFIHLVDEIRTALAGFNWRAQLKPGHVGSFDKVALATTNYLRNPTTPGNKVDAGEETLADRFRRLTRQLTTARALCSASEVLTPYRTEVQFYELVRVYMAKYDAEARRADGKPVPEEISRLLAALISDSTTTGEVLDIYAAAGLDKPQLSDLNPAYLAMAQQASNPHLAIEALRKHVLGESRRATGNNIARERLFSERVAELMNRYANEQLTAAQVIAELIEMAKDIRAEAARGARFTPRSTTTSSPSTTPSRRTTPPCSSRARTCSLRSPATSSPSCVATSARTGPSATTSAPSSVRRSSGCWSATATRPTSSPPRSNSSSSRWSSSLPITRTVSVTRG